MNSSSWNTSIECLPAEFLDRLPHVLAPDDLTLFADHVSNERPLTIRITDPSLTRSDVVSALDSRGLNCRYQDWMPESLWLTPPDRALLNETPLSQENRIFRQSLSSMAAVESMDVRSGHDVLDCCAAPGGKSSLIRRRQESEGILVANDLSRRRVSRMKQVFELNGVTGIDTQVNDAKSLGSMFPGCFDRVLLDAPCSGEGRFHIDDPASWADWNPGKIRRLGKLQASLLKSAIQTLRPGGLLVYATCTLAPEENECVLAKVLTRHSSLVRIEPIGIEFEGRRQALSQWNGSTFPEWMSAAVRIVPEYGMTPFFLAAIRRV
ncbi:MAG: hypothetical protein CMJ40_06430 [Phycisphaerae bacterium]|nr:hypothetical protein [Phycisphaerae bacterium]